MLHFCTRVTLFALVLHVNCTVLSHQNRAIFFTYVLIVYKFLTPAWADNFYCLIIWISRTKYPSKTVEVYFEFISEMNRHGRNRNLILTRKAVRNFNLKSWLELRVGVPKARTLTVMSSCKTPRYVLLAAYKQPAKRSAFGGCWFAETSVTNFFILF